MNDFESYLCQFKDKIKTLQLKLISEKSIPYGVQFIITNGLSKVPVNIYSGKKGISTTVGGSKSELRVLLLRLLGKDVPIELTDNTVELGQRVPPGFESVNDFDFQWIGTDESGKGDFFGPLVVAGVRVDEQSAAELEVLGVRDSKRLSDEKNQVIAAKIRKACVGQYVEIEISPARYNELYGQMQKEGKNLNHLLAWAHARVLEDLLAKAPCQFAIADQFANEDYILSRLMQKGRKINLVQTHKAERNIAVAAASILARDRYLTWMAKQSEKWGQVLPKGASIIVIEAAKSLSLKYGKECLSHICKMHFKTLEKV